MEHRPFDINEWYQDEIEEDDTNALYWVCNECGETASEKEDIPHASGCSIGEIERLYTVVEDFTGQVRRLVDAGRIGLTDDALERLKAKIVDIRSGIGLA